MQSTLTPQETDPHDVFVIEPDVVLAARQASPDPVQELLSHLAHKAAERSPEASAAVPTPKIVTPTLDTTFRAAATDKIDTTDRPAAPNDRPGISWWVKRAFIAFMFALCSAFAAAAWTHHGAAARQIITSWLPPFVLAASPVSEKPAADTPAAAEQQPDSAPAQATAADQAPAQPASVAQVKDSAAPAAAASPAPSAPTTQSPTTESMARDLKTMGQQIEQLKASIEQLKASQAQMSRDVIKNSEAKNSEARNSEPSPRPKTSAASPRPMAAIPPRPIPAPPRKPRTAYLPPPAVITSPPPTYAVPPPLPPPPLPQPVVSQPMVSQPAPLPEATVPSDDGPVIRPPMPLR
jgi:hypothetical protein